MLISRLIAVLIIFFPPVQGMDGKHKQANGKLSSDSYKQRLTKGQEDLEKLPQESQVALESQEDTVTLTKKQIREQCSNLSIPKPFPQELNKLLARVEPPEQLFSPEERKNLTELICTHNFRPIRQIRQQLQLFTRKWKMLAEYSSYDLCAYYTFWYEKAWTELVEKITSSFSAINQKAIDQQLLKEIYDAYYFFHKQSASLLNAYENLARNSVSLPDPLLYLKATFDEIRYFFDIRGAALWQIIICYIKSLDLWERYTFSCLGTDPPFTELNNLDLGVLGLYVSTGDNNKLYCKLKNINPPIEITSQGRKTIKGIPLEVFGRIKRAVEQKFELSNDDKKALIDFLSQFSYEAPRVDSGSQAVDYPYTLSQNLNPFINYEKLPVDFYMGGNPIELIIVSLNKKTKVYFDYPTKMSLLSRLTPAFTYPQHWQEKMMGFIKAARQVFSAKCITEQLEKLDRYYEGFLETCKYNTSVVSNMIKPQVTITMPGYQGRTSQQIARGACDLFSNGDICFDLPNPKIEGIIAESLIHNIKFTKGRSIPLNSGEQLAWFLSEQLFNLPSDPTVFVAFDNIHFLQPPPLIAKRFEKSGTLKPTNYWNSYFENPDDWTDNSKFCFSIAHRQIEEELLGDFFKKVTLGQAYLHQINPLSLGMQILFNLLTQSSISPANFALVKDKAGSQFSLKRVYNDIQANDSFHSPSFGRVPVHKLCLKAELLTHTEPEMGKMYIEKKVNDKLWYTVKRPDGPVVTKSLRVTTYEELTEDILEEFKSQILEEARQNGDILPSHILIRSNFLYASPWAFEKIPQEVKNEFASNDVLPLLLHWLHKLNKFQVGYFDPLIKKYNLDVQDPSLYGGSQAQSWGLKILTHPQLIEQLLKNFSLICKLLKSNEDITYFQLFEKLYPHEAQVYSALITQEQQKAQSRETQLFFTMAPSLIKRLALLNSGMADLGEVPAYTEEELTVLEKLASAYLEEALKNNQMSFDNLLKSITSESKSTAFFQEKYEWAKKIGVFAVDRFYSVWTRLVEGNLIYEELIKQEHQLPWDNIITSDGTKSPTDIQFSEATCSVQEMIKQLVYQAELSKDTHKALEELELILKVFPDFDSRKHNYHRSWLPIRQAARKEFLAVPLPAQQLFNRLSDYAEEEKEALQKVYLHAFEHYENYFQSLKESYIDFIQYNAHLKERVASYHFRRLMGGYIKGLREEEAMFLEAILDLLLLPEHRLAQVSGNIADDPGSSGFASQDHTKTGPNIIDYKEGTHFPPHNEIWGQLFASSQKLPHTIRYMIVSHHLPLLLLHWAKDLAELGLDIKFHLWFSEMLPQKTKQLQELVLNHPDLTFKKIMLRLWPEYYHTYEKQSQNGKKKLKKLPSLESEGNLSWIPKGHQKNLFTLIHEWDDRWLAYHSAAPVSLERFATEIFGHVNPESYFKTPQKETSAGNMILFYMLGLASQLPINVHEITHSPWEKENIFHYFSIIYGNSLPYVSQGANQLALALRLGCTAGSVQLHRKKGFLKISNLKRKDLPVLCEVLEYFSGTDFIKTLDLSSNQILFPNGGCLYFLSEDQAADVDHLPAIRRLQSGKYQLFKRTDVYSQIRGYVSKPLSPKSLNIMPKTLDGLWQQGQAYQKILVHYDDPLMQQLTTSPYQQFINILKKFKNLKTLILSDNPISDADFLIHLLQLERNPDSPLQTLILEKTYTHQFPSSYIELIRSQNSAKEFTSSCVSAKKETSKDCMVIINNKASIKPEHFDLTHKERKEIFGELQLLLKVYWKDRNKKTVLNKEGCITFTDISYLDKIASVVEQLGDNFWNESLAATPESWAQALVKGSGDNLQELIDVLNVCNQARQTHGKPPIKESAFKLAFAIQFGLPQGATQEGLVFHQNNGSAGSRTLSQPLPITTSISLTTKAPRPEPQKRKESRDDDKSGQTSSLKTRVKLSLPLSKPALEENHSHNPITKEASGLKYLTISGVPAPQGFYKTLRPFSQLTRLHLPSLGLITLDILPSIQTLQFLDLSGNQLTSLEGLSNKYPRLYNLKVPQNKIRELSSLLKMEKLVYFNISGNEIEDFMGLCTTQPPAFKLPSIKYLDLSHNQIVMEAAYWNVARQHLPSCLEHFDLSYNQLTFAPTMKRYPAKFFVNDNNIDVKDFHKIFSFQLGDIILLQENKNSKFYDKILVPNPAEITISKRNLDLHGNEFYCEIKGKKPLFLNKTSPQLQSILNGFAESGMLEDRGKELLIEFIVNFDPYYLNTPDYFLLIPQNTTSKTYTY